MAAGALPCMRRIPGLRRGALRFLPDTDVSALAAETFGSRDEGADESDPLVGRPIAARSQEGSQEMAGAPCVASPGGIYDIRVPVRLFIADNRKGEYGGSHGDRRGRH